jgi:hypothetical protein
MRIVTVPVLLLLSVATMGQIRRGDGSLETPILPADCFGTGKALTIEAGLFGCNTIEGGSGAPADATYLTQTAHAGLSAEQALSALATGLLKVTNGTGVLSTASAPADYVATGDSRLSDARTPLGHAATHISSGSDPINGATTAVRGTVELATDGESAANLVPQANDARLSNARTPTAHETTHRSGGSDALSVLTLSGYPGGTTNFLRADGAFAAPPGGGGGATKLIVTADRQNTTTTFADVTDLTLAVSATTRYVFECVLTSTTAVSTTAMQVSVNGPTQTSLRYTVETATTASATHRATQTAYDTVTNPATGAAAVPLPVYLRGQILTNGSGTLAVRFRSEVSASAVNILAGSYCLVQ